MEVISFAGQPPQSHRPQVLAIGKFDGIHIGHHAILRTATSHLADADLAVMSFSPHPLFVLAGREEYQQLLTPLPEKVHLLEQHGVKRLYLIEFSRAYAETSAAAFVHDQLSRLHLHRVVVGADFRFGQGGVADVAALTALCEEIGVPVSVVSAVEENGVKVSSSQIRRHLAAGRVEAAEALLGRAYAVTGMVVHGDHLGRTIGFPTANFGQVDEYVMPKTGVYAVSVQIAEQHGQIWFGVANAGYRPTVNGSDFRLEVHLLGFSGDLYGMTLRVSFLRRIRDERKFAGIDELRAQISADSALARSMVGLDEA